MLVLFTDQIIHHDPRQNTTVDRIFETNRQRRLLVERGSVHLQTRALWAFAGVHNERKILKQKSEPICCAEENWWAFTSGLWSDIARFLLPLRHLDQIFFDRHIRRTVAT